MISNFAVGLRSELRTWEFAYVKPEQRFKDCLRAAADFDLSGLALVELQHTRGSRSCKPPSWRRSSYEILGEAGTTGGSGDDLVVTAAGTREFSGFIMFTAEATDCLSALEAAHASDAAFDAAMLLLNLVVQVGTISMSGGLPQDARPPG